ncbi:methyltransferase [Streptomyces sp. NPDC093252]|uniref:methyltransferase n=1 Tax=Streptomyces sp. NPDC093252 TaxID=3154980 RepID=UPI0034155623
MSTPTPAPTPRTLDELSDIVTPYAIRIAATLRLADHMAAGHTKVADLAEASGTRPRPLAAILEYLSRRGVFARLSPQEFGLNAEAERLRDDHPGGLRFRLDLDEVGSHVETAHLSYIDFARRDAESGSAYQARYGTDLWTALAQDPALGVSWDRFMSMITQIATDQVVTRFDWSRRSHLVDVGGGSGTLLLAVLAAHPELSGTLVEIDPAASAAREAIQAAGLGTRATVAEQSFFAPLPDGGDVYLLAQVLHDWDDADAVRILRRCAEAAGPDGRVLLVERLPHLDTSRLHASWMDLRMLMLFGGGERTEEQYRTLITDAGMSLDLTQVVSSGALGGEMVLLECSVRR